MRSGLVLPFWVKAETYGTEGSVLNTEAKVKELKEDILVGLGMAKSVVTGDGPNFATASVSMQKMVVQLKRIKQAGREILDWVYDQWLEENKFDKYEVHYEFSDLDLTSEVAQKQLLVELYDRGLISKGTLQQKMGLSPEVEAKDAGIEVDRTWTVQDVGQLVALEVLTVDEARAKLGLTRPGKQAREAAAEKDVSRLYAKVDGTGLGAAGGSK